MQDHLRLARGPLIAVGVLSGAVNLLLLVPALFMLQVFDRVLASGSRETLLVLLLGVALALLLMLVLDHLRARLQGVIGNLLGESLLPPVAREVLARNARSPQRLPPDALRDVAALRGLFSAQALLALFDAPWVIVYVGVIWLAHPALGVASAAAALLMLSIALVNDRLTRRSIEKVQYEAGGAMRYLESSMVNAEAAEAMGMTDALLARWQRLNARVQALQAPTAARSVALAALTRMARQAVQVSILAVGAWLVITRSATPGVMVAATILLGRALAPVEQVVGSWRVLAEGRAAARRLSELIGALDAAPSTLALPAPTGLLRAENLVWRAPGSERLVLAGVSLQLDVGESLVVVGPSGAGKSTLLRVLAGLWRPTAGTVRLDAADIARWPREDLGPHIGYVPQDVELFPGTIAENIARLGEADGTLVTRAAKAAGVHEMILALPDGYDTSIEPTGILLSPGQRQRIALARALYGEPKVLLLDEPNSNLDGAGEQALGLAIAALAGKATTVMVTHRSTLVQHADKMLVLEAGRATHFGPLAEVLRATREGGARVVPMPRAASEAAR
jgi:PrtD family type I secretion system ABC transporter